MRASAIALGPQVAQPILKIQKLWLLPHHSVRQTRLPNQPAARRVGFLEGSSWYF